MQRSGSVWRCAPLRLHRLGLLGAALGCQSKLAGGRCDVHHVGCSRLRGHAGVRAQRHELRHATDVYGTDVYGTDFRYDFRVVCSLARCHHARAVFRPGRGSRGQRGCAHPDRQCVLSTATLAQAERSIGACGIDHVIGGGCEGGFLSRNILVGSDTSETEAVIAQSRQHYQNALRGVQSKRQVIAYAHCAVTVVRQPTS